MRNKKGRKSKRDTRVGNQASLWVNTASTDGTNVASHLLMMLPSQRHYLDVHNFAVLVTYIVPLCDIKPWGFIGDEVSIPGAMLASLQNYDARIPGQGWKDLLVAMMQETGLEVRGEGYVVDPANKLVGLDVVGCLTRVAVGITWFSEKDIAVGGLASEVVLERMRRAWGEPRGAAHSCLECEIRGFT